MQKNTGTGHSAGVPLCFLLAFVLVAPSFLSAASIGQDGTLTLTRNDFRPECQSASSITLGFNYAKLTEPGSVNYDDDPNGDLTDLSITLSSKKPFLGIDARDCDQSLKFTNARKMSIDSLEFSGFDGFFQDSSCTPAYCYVDISDNKIQVSLNPVTIKGDRFTTDTPIQNINSVLSLAFGSGTTLKMDFAEMRAIREGNAMRYILSPPSSIVLNGFRLFETPVGGPKLDVLMQGSTMRCASTSCTSDKYPAKIIVQRYELPVVSAIKKDGFYLCGSDSVCLLTQILYSNSQLSMTIGTKVINPFAIKNLFPTPVQTVPKKKTVTKPAYTGTGK